jgi:hypothetical protein
MSLFAYNPFRISEELLPPQLRKPKMIAWLRVLLRPLAWMTDLFLDDYCNGVPYLNYDNSTAYVIYDRVIWEDGGVYELRVSTSTGVIPTGNTLSSTNWRKVLENFIGADQRIKITGQLIVFEKAINDQFQITAPPYIYCTAIVPGITQVFVEIKVPTAVYNALGANNTARDARITNWAGQYTLGGIAITVTPY